MMCRIMILALIVLTIACSKDSPGRNKDKRPLSLMPEKKIKAKSLIHPKGMTVYKRIQSPEGYMRPKVLKSSFAYYLRHLPLKSHDFKVRYFDGYIKEKGAVYLAVVDMDIGKKDLQQCADAVMRLRGEYLYGQKRYKRIHFNFLKDGRPRYYKNYADKSYSYRSFRKYMDYVFMNANTRSLHRELKKVVWKDMKAGDVFIQKGKPYGHAIIVLDVAQAKVSGRKLFLLAQSYMPAQDIQILVNPKDKETSPWYQHTFEGSFVVTPEWIFKRGDLKRFK